MRPKTGEIVWHYQFTPNDAFDFDANWEMIIADIDVDGQKRKVIMQLNRNGFLYVIDRTNGKLIAAKPFEKVNWATPHRHGDRPAGGNRRRQEAAQHASRSRCGRRRRGGKNWPHAAFNPETGLLYANTIHQSRHLSSICRDQAARGRPALHVIENKPIAGRSRAKRSAISRRSTR